MPTVSIVFRKDKLNKKKEAPINFRITKDRKSSYITSKLIIPERFWDYGKSKVRSGYPNSVRVNNYLISKQSELQGGVIEIETNYKSLESKQLKEQIYGKKPTPFFPFAIETNNKYLSKGGISTYDKSKSIITKLNDYLIEKGLSTDLTLQDITVDFLSRYEEYLRNKLRNKTNTVHTNLKYFRKIFNDAYRMGLIEHHNNPFLKYKLSQEKTQITYLTDDELKNFENASLPANTRLDLHRDMFLFASFAGGIRVGDLLLLRWSNFDGKRIHFSMRKTKRQISFELPDKALKIVKKYKPNEIEPLTFIFPMLHPELNIDDARALDNAISSAEAYINKNLKIIAKKVELPKKIHFNVSRHTWATQALSKGMPIHLVSKIMAHTSVKQTEVYAKILGLDIDKAMADLNRKINGTKSKS